MPLQLGYEMEENTGDDLADSSGLGNTATDVGANPMLRDASIFKFGAKSLFNDNSGMEMSTDFGTNLSPNFPGRLGYTATGFTCSFWIWVDPASSGTAIVFSKADTFFTRLKAPNKITFTLTDLLNVDHAIDANDNSIPRSQWNHVFCRWSAATTLMELWVNNVQQTATANFGGGLDDGVDKLFLMRAVFGPVIKLDDIAIFDEAISDADKDFLFQHGLNAFLFGLPPTPAAPTESADFDPGPGQTAQNYIDSDYTARTVKSAREAAVEALPDSSRDTVAGRASAGSRYASGAGSAADLVED